MVVCFDTSALNQLMDDPESDRLTAIFWFFDSCREDPNILW